MTERDAVTSALDGPLVNARATSAAVAPWAPTPGRSSTARGSSRRASATARGLLPRAVLLLPGVGAQGGRTEDLSPAFAAGPASALVSASRSVIYAARSARWQEAAAAEAARLADVLRSVAVPG